ncbi:MAG: hypothetical protein IKZ61_04685 [Prevotella sp.]|nr:hypothetical protein [Prevotella sp.]
MNETRYSNTDIQRFAEKYIQFFNEKFGRIPAAYYEFFYSETFPNECRAFGFDMDCGQSFIDTYGQEAWSSNDGLLSVIDKANDIKILGSGLFSQWRYFNHWACSYATKEDKKWFLTILHRLQELSVDGNNRTHKM